METWLLLRPVILDELIRREGLQENESLPKCSSCAEELGAYRCISCTTPMLRCAPCIIYQHENLPLHRLEVCPRLLNDTAASSSNRSGMERFSNSRPSKILTTAFISAISTPLARRPTHKLKLYS